MPAQKYKQFNEYTKEGSEFKKLWMDADRDGIQNKIAERFGISVPTVYRIRKMLKLPDLHGKDHPGRKKLERRVKRLYKWGLKHKGIGGISTIRIAKLLKMSSQNINIILKKQGVKLGPQHVTNPLYFKTRSKITPSQLALKIRKMYLEEKKSAAEIARELKLDQGTISTKLKAMNIDIISRRHIEAEVLVIPSFNIIGIYLGNREPFTVINQSERWIIRNMKEQKPSKSSHCQWCNKFFPQYIAEGPRTQKFCSSSCKNKAKDYRRMLRFKKPSLERLMQFEKFLHDTWKDNYDIAVEKLISVKPLMEVKHEDIKSSKNDVGISASNDAVNKGIAEQVIAV
jgi:DNA-binding CsgD family transcriptional regulator